jgi:broad specificity phosphatase PhoE
VTVVLGIRHGLVENPRGVVYGRLPGFPLSDEGRKAARWLAALLASAPVRAVYSSPLERARETAAALAAPHGLEVHSEERLTEWGGLSPWQGQPWAEVMQLPEVAAAYAGDPAELAPDEPLPAMGRRVLDWAMEIASRHNDGMVVGVSHEAPLAAAYLVGRGQDFGSFRATDIPHLFGVRLEPGPPELIDPAQALHTC